MPRAARGEHGGVAWVLAPALALALGVTVLRLTAGGPDGLALLAAVATPVLAAARTWVAAPLWLVAWLAPGLVAQAAGIVLIALAATTLAERSPRRAAAGALVVLAVVDVVLVWGTPQVGPAMRALHAAAPPFGIPALQDATFGDARMGWLDLLAPALLGVAVAGSRRTRAAVVTGLAAGAWGMLLLVTDTVPATVPTLVGLLCASL